MTWQQLELHCSEHLSHTFHCLNKAGAPFTAFHMLFKQVGHCQTLCSFLLSYAHQVPPQSMPFLTTDTCKVGQMCLLNEVKPMKPECNASPLRSFSAVLFAVLDAMTFRG